MGYREDLVGKRYGTLTVVKREASGHNYTSRWLCKCDCNMELVIAGVTLKAGTTKSCGKTECLRPERSWEVKRSVWKDKVRKRDNYTCQKCMKKYTAPHTHHILSYIDYPELAFDIDNGITLCENCHITFHFVYGRKNFTKEHLTQFLAEKVE